MGAITQSFVNAASEEPNAGTNTKSQKLPKIDLATQQSILRGPFKKATNAPSYDADPYEVAAKVNDYIHSDRFRFADVAMGCSGLEGMHMDFTRHGKKRLADMMKRSAKQNGWTTERTELEHAARCAASGNSFFKKKLGLER